MYKRAQLSVLESRLAEPRRTIHVVMGPRQVGKSTMIDQFVEQTSVPYSLFSADGVGKTNTDWISEKWYEVRTKMMLYFRNKFGKNIVNSFIVGPEGLPLEDFFKLNIPALFRTSLK